MISHFGIGELTIAYVIVCALLLCLLLKATWSWRGKAAAIVVLSASYIVIYAAWPSLLGWPTRQDLPEQFRLVAGYIQQPDRISGEEGSIYLWASDLTVQAGQGTPRAYRLPYTLELQDKVTKAGDKLSKNTPQLGKTETDAGRPAKIPRSARQLGQQSSKLDFYDMPAPVVPEK